MHLPRAAARTLGRRALHTTPHPAATPLYMLSALSHARETQHFARASGLSVTHHVPTLEAIQSSEVAPFQTTPVSSASTPAASTPAVAAAAARGGAEADVRRRIAARLLRGDDSPLAPGGPAVLHTRRAELALAVAAGPGEDGALSPAVRNRLAAARAADVAYASRPLPAAVVGEAVAAPAAAVPEETVLLEQKDAREKKYQTFSPDQMQIMLLVALVALVGVNAYAFETLGAERRALGLLAGRVAHVESYLAQATGHAAPAAPAVAAGSAAPMVAETQEVAVVGSSAVPQRRPLGEKMAGWLHAAFWAN